MNSFDITDTGRFVKALLSEDFFAKMLLYYAEIKGACRIEIDGRLNRDFYDSGDEALITPGGRDISYIRWGNIRNQFFEGIRGSRLPLRFSVSLITDPDFLYDFVTSSGVNIRPDEVESLNINIMYDRGGLTVTTGNSYKIFTLDKNLDTIWDLFVHNTFKELDIL